MDDEDFLAAVEADNARVDEPQAEPAPLELTEETEPAQAETPAEPLPEPTPEATPEPQTAPITALLDEREKRQAEKARADKLEADLAQLRAQQQPEQVPDVFDENFAAYQEQKINQALYQQNLRWSERTATIEHGAETVTTAKEWGLARCDADPYFNAKVAASPDPVGFVVSEWKREQIASQVTPEDLTQFQAWKAAQAQLQAPAAEPAATPSSRTAPPRSLASAPSAGGVLTEVAQTDEEIFAEVLPKR